VSSSLLLLFFGRQRRIQIEHPFGQLHVYLPVLEVHAFQIRFGVGNLVAPASRADNQQRRFARAKLNFFNLANLAACIKYRAADQVAYVIPSCFELCPLTLRNLQFAAYQNLGIGDRINSRELQNQVTLVRPELFNQQFASAVVLRESE